MVTSGKHVNGGCCFDCKYLDTVVIATTIRVTHMARIRRW
jgi:hypothetical protein